MNVKQFLLARIDEDEAMADQAAGVNEGMEYGDADWCPDWAYSGIRHLVRNCDVECMTHEDEWGTGCGRPGRYAGAHVANWDPARVRHECNIKRLIIAHPATPGTTLYDMAGVWRDHPDHRSIFVHLL